MKRLLILFLIPLTLEGFAQSITNGLILHLPFNGNANDVSGNSLHGTVTGAQLTTDQSGNINSAYHFTHTNEDFINVPENALLRPSNITFSAWFKMETGNTIYPILYKGTIADTSSYQYSVFTLGDGSDDINFYSQIRTSSLCDHWENSSEPLVDKLASISFGTWHHVVITYNGTDLKMYLDNTQVFSSTGTSANIYDCVGGGLNIGVCPVGGASLTQGYFNGSIDEVRIYNRALTSTEVSLLYGSTTNTIASVHSNQFSISPNPSTTGNYLIETTTLLKSPEFLILDYMGKEVPFKLVYGQNNYEIDISSCSKGLYTLQIKDGEEIFSKKLLNY